MMAIDGLEVALGAGAVAGVIIAVIGIVRARVTSLALGACIVSYSFTGLTYVPLLYTPPHPLSVMDRMWGGMTAVLAGAALVGVIISTLGGEEATATQRDRMRVWLMATTMAALLSLAGIYFSLRTYADLTPSTDFLNDYAHLVGVSTYQCIFAAWIAIPAGALGISNVLARQLGWPRWVVFAGGFSGVLWGVWKVAGVVFAGVAGDRIRLESPISVALGLAALILCVLGLVLTGLRGRREVRTRRSRYLYRRRIEDADFHSSGCSGRSDSDNSPIAAGSVQQD